jgi:hypothetical protein
MATALASGLMALILHLHDILHQNDRRDPGSYRERMKDRTKVRNIFNSLRDDSDGIILAHVHFKPDSSQAELDKTPDKQMPQKAKALLDKVLYAALKYVS